MVTRTNRKYDHPSNRLYRDEIHTLPEAVVTLLAAVRYERAWNRRYLEEFPEEAARSAFSDDLFADTERDARAALVIYQEIMRETKANMLKRLRAAKLDEWADALESGDYSGLAI